MGMLTVALDLPRDLLGALDVSQTQLEARLRELIALELFREGRISSGKGAELLGVSKLEFVRLLAQNQVAYFTEIPEELKAEVTETQRLLDGSGS
jgi:predicted HTH domain antitoxin